jgi:hypothetical protein
MSKKIIFIIAIIAALGIGFGGGLLVSSHHKGVHNGKAGKHHHALATKGAVTSGTVLSSSGSTLTIKLTNGNTETIYTGSNTSYSQVSTISSSSITNGATVRVIGAKNSDGSVTAKKIILQ